MVRRVICPACHVEFTPGHTRERRLCPNCGAPPVRRWRRMAERGRPIPLAVGVGLQGIAEIVTVPGPAQQGLGVAASLARFASGTLLFALIAGLLMLAVQLGYRAWRRARSRRRARRW